MKMTAHGKSSSAKPSGADWLGDVPADWAVKKMKYLFRDHSQKGRPDAALLSVTQDQGVVPRSWVETRMVMPSGGLDTFKFIAKGDFAISLRSFEGGLEYCHHDGIISPAYTVLKAWHADLVSGYYRHLFKSNAFISELQTAVVGIREGKNISFAELSHSLMPIPPASEQAAIANFLDRKCAKVDEAVRIKEEQIALLRERRQILIQEAVTRGLNPDAPMKDSGIEWLGPIPSHWKLLPLKFIAQLKSGETISSERFTSEGFPVFGGNGFRGYTDAYTHEGDFVLIGRQGALCGNVNYASGRFFASEHAIVATPRSQADKLWLGELIRSANLNRLSQSAAQPGLSVEVVGNQRFPYAPFVEQVEIGNYVEEIANKFDVAIALKSDQISTLKEYKTTLINAAVTGKIKVT